MKQSNSKSGQTSPKVSESARETDKTKINKNSESMTNSPAKVVVSQVSEPSIVNKDEKIRSFELKKDTKDSSDLEVPDFQADVKSPHLRDSVNSQPDC